MATYFSAQIDVPLGDGGAANLGAAEVPLGAGIAPNGAGPTYRMKPP